MQETYANAIGDSFLNKCFLTNSFFSALRDIYTPVFGWTEPYPLLLLLLILLIVLPTIFKYSSHNSFLKISRLYNITRLSLISLLHQIGYSYTFSVPLSSLVRQPPPCVESKTIDFSLSEYSFPSAIMMSASMLFFAVAKFSDVKKLVFIIAFIVFTIIFAIVNIAQAFGSLFQVISTILISYIIHFIHIHIPFRLIHIENIVLIGLNLAAMLVLFTSQDESVQAIFYTFVFPIVVVIIDELILTRHHFSRKGFRAIEKPGDITWNIETQHSETIRLLNSEEEESFQSNLKSDIITSFFAFFVFFIAIIMRRLIVPNDFFVAPT